MKQLKMVLLLTAIICTQNNSFAQTKVNIGNLYYYLSGTSASVAPYQEYQGKSLYNQDSYSIPQTITNDGLTYTVNKIYRTAFAGVDGIYGGSTASSIILPNTIEEIGMWAFARCQKLSSMVIPSSVKNMEGEPFKGCNILRELIYLPSTAPKYWTATTKTYVPDIQSYSSPKYSINDAHVIEMISFAEHEFTYTGLSPTTTWSHNIEGASVEFEMPILKSDVGKYEEIIPLAFKKDNKWYKTNVVYRYNINPAKLTAKVENVSRIYGDENPPFICSYSGFVNGENENIILTEPTISTVATKTSDVGEYPITASGGNARNYTFVYEPGTLTITKVPLTAKVNDETRQYGKDNLAFTISYTGLKNGETEPKWEENLKIETSATKESDVGTYAITATGIPVNYDLPRIENGTLTITQAPLTIKANDANRQYFEDEPNFDYSCTGFLNNDNIQVLTKKPTITTEATKTSKVGKYKITPSDAETKNYTISYEQGELTITKRQLIATSYCTRKYGEDNPLLIIEYYGLVNNETEDVISVKPIATTTAEATSPVGEYPITLSGGKADNYTFVYEPGILTITKASLSAKVNDTTKVYGTKNPTFTIEYYGLRNGETIPTWITTPTFQTEATQASGVGQYTVKAVNGIPQNYDLEIADGILSITPAQLTIKANNAVRIYYSDDPTFSYTCNGFVNGENENVLNPKPTLSTSATRTSDVGTYEIKVGEALNSNYSISYINGTLTITPRTLTASVGNYERLYNEDNPVFEVKYDGFVNNEDENVLSTKATANTTATKTSDVGTYPIKVTGGNADNYTFNYTSGTLTINKAEQIISWEQDFNGLEIGDQVELTANASSGLPITYTIDNNSFAEIYSAGKKYYLDCKAEGEVWIMAVQEGNQNYYSSQRIRKKIVIGNINDDSKYDLNGDGKISAGDIQVIINEMKKPTGNQNMKYDLNGDGKISAGDIQVIINEMKK